MIEENHALTPYTDLASFGQIANAETERNALQAYRQKLSMQTKDNQRSDVKVFETFLRSQGVQVKNMDTDLEQWRGITHGIIEKYLNWQVLQRYATGAITVRLATVKAYVKAAASAGILTDARELALIHAVRGFGQRSVARNVDEERKHINVATRISSKKAEPIALSVEQIAFLKTQPDTEVGRRDALILHLLCDLGLRVSEACHLRLSGITLRSPWKESSLKFYRHKVYKDQELRLTEGVFETARRYVAGLTEEHRANPMHYLFHGYTAHTAGKAPHQPVYTRALTRQAVYNRVQILGWERLGVENLSPHDLRHTLFTHLIRVKGIDLKAAQDLGGWAKPDMVLRYALSADVPNANVVYPEGWSIFPERSYETTTSSDNLSPM
jgi:site-specific recombinase XerD